ncbi:hypothetical protein R4Z10_19520 [Niallia sp. XMNu-256]|uniref:hypothetical protein n=1 Tax=Niallia sp. XMNu-256 TaxID=3082444 RepID=UPI0030D423FE
MSSKVSRRIKKITSRENEFDYLAVGHGKPLRDKNMILAYIEMAEKLLNRDAKGTYETTSIRRGWVYRENGLELWYKSKCRDKRADTST